MLGSGALNLFEYNTFEDLCFEVSDSGAWYSGYSWTHRGNVLNGNSFTRIQAVELTWLGWDNVQVRFYVFSYFFSLFVCIETQGVIARMKARKLLRRDRPCHAVYVS